MGVRKTRTDDGVLFSSKSADTAAIGRNLELGE
jgi:hypothetical protein